MNFLCAFAIDGLACALWPFNLLEVIFSRSGNKIEEHHCHRHRPGVDIINEDKVENNMKNYQIEQAEALMEDLELASEKTGEVLKQVRILMMRRLGKMENLDGEDPNEEMEMEQLEHFPQVILMPSTQDTNLLGNKTNRDSTLEISNETGQNAEKTEKLSRRAVLRRNHRENE